MPSNRNRVWRLHVNPFLFIITKINIKIDNNKWNSYFNSSFLTSEVVAAKYSICIIAHVGLYSSPRSTWRIRFGGWTEPISSCQDAFVCTRLKLFLSASPHCTLSMYIFGLLASCILCGWSSSFSACSWLIFSV
jgi:hypothetical protein